MNSTAKAPPFVDGLKEIVIVATALKANYA